jgi:deoxyribose-phosphate aldolase
MAALTAVARKTGTAVKVIFETCYLADEEIAEAAKIASRVKPDFIKTSTGFGTGGATAAHVDLMHANCGPDVCVKASGGIRSWAEAKAMLDAGASRLGVSAGMKIISELKEQEG